MAKQFILAEKPSVAKEIARVMGARDNRGAYYEGDRVIVTWAYGHLVTHADPEQYDKKYSHWVLEDLPLLPAHLKLVVMPKTAKHFNAIKALLNRQDISEVVIATDAGREGELVARWILEKAGSKKPIKRLWISSVTDKAIREGFNALKPGKQYETLYHAAVARAEGDWLVGINATRALTTKFNIPLSCGRVQTPTLAMVKAREDVIKRFVPKDFFGLSAQWGAVTFTYEDGMHQKTFFDEKLVDSLLTSAGSESLKVADVSKQSKQLTAPLLYDLTELQKEAHGSFGFSPKKTLSIVQRLYEQHKALTYPRTDSKYLTSDMVGTLRDRLMALKDDSHREFAQKLLKDGYQVTKSVVDNSKVSDHHAIIPTEEPLRTRGVEREDWLIYDMVAKRFMAALMPVHRYEETSVRTVVGKLSFVTKGKRTLDLGWKALYGSGSGASGDSLPEFKVGQVLAPVVYKKTKGQTAPPPYYTEGTLLGAMENPPLDEVNEQDSSSGNQQALKKILGETGGLGTVATRADIMEKLFGGFLLELKGQQVHMTNKGRQLLEVAPKDLKSPRLTAQWEIKLDRIAKGQLKGSDFVAEMRLYTQEIVAGIKGSAAAFKHDNVSTTPCPKCGQKLLSVQTKTGKSLVCPDRNCGHRESTARETNARCPECKKKMTLVSAGDDKMFTCRCGYRERLSAFEKRREAEGSKGGKSDYKAYLEQKDKADKEPSDTVDPNNPFAKALAGLKK